MNRGNIVKELQEYDFKLEMFFADKLFESNYVLQKEMVTLNPKSNIVSGNVTRKNNTNTSVTGFVKVNNNPVIREVVAFNDQNIIIGKTLSASDGTFTIPLKNNPEEVYCIARDPKFQFLLSCSANSTILALTLVDVLTQKIITGIHYPINLPKNFLVNSILKCESEEIFINSVEMEDNFFGDSQVNIPIAIVVNVTRAYNSTTNVAHSEKIGTIKKYNDIIYSHQVGV